MDNDIYIKTIAREIGISLKQVTGTVKLLNEDATVPFIARYRKETTGDLDETEIIKIRDRLKTLAELYKRREAILKSIEDQGKLTPDLNKKILKADSLSILEDIYLPFKPKRKTRAIIAKEKGLEPLALTLLSQEDIDVKKEAEKYLSTEKQVNTTEEALKGAQDIIAEIINEDPETRKKMRQLFTENAFLSSKVIKGKEEPGKKYKDYFDWNEKISKIPSHRLLAVLRGTAEGYLSHHILPEQEKVFLILEKMYIKNNSESSVYVKNALIDCYKRLLSPSMENEIRASGKNKADTDAIKVFAGNLKELLLSAPLGQKNVLAIDPGFRTGCKVVCLDSQGKLLFADTIYPLEPHNKLSDSEKKLKELCEKFKIEAIAVGNGTGGREAKKFCESTDDLNNPDIVMVNESGASVYSASKTARLEFPDYDV
ncbi:MAG: RNA-binding transcriptional accessory protein, partial [Spirochaetes bacterium]|nr:RNA-binding transcriptional accessory protein [Spirochaetota bacterium]